ncbi:hypothetical protein [Brumicola pallidula]|uniref:Uncharacterized protein n=1 Tax=Brumicola pallidula DSM 14239 = ACAM 615 TaxID=1121922 RepID=K6Y3Q0_9ALTE|nr:hypothetical protein [Glaciecola pallidula]GAC27424.1 hypothetical protein GPAL_0544 [Glaciecola pallidula DSM 14239 = ACAM 615]
MHEEIFGQLTVEDMYIKQAFDFYRDCLLGSDNKRLIASSLTTIPTELQSHAYTGICDRTLGLHIPNGRTLEGGAIRDQLQHCGLLTAKGGELFRGCVVFPKRDEFGHFVSAVGYRYGRVRSWQPAVIRWHKPELGQFVIDGMKLVKEIAYAKAKH